MGPGSGGSFSARRRWLLSSALPIPANFSRNFFQKRRPQQCHVGAVKVGVSPGETCADKTRDLTLVPKGIAKADGFFYRRSRPTLQPGNPTHVISSWITTVYDMTCCKP